MVKFQPDDMVRVRTDAPPGHVRTPAYLRGKTGVVERVLGRFPNPEALAYGHTGYHRQLCRVRFVMGDVWGTDAENPHDTVDAEIYAHWLEEVH